MQSVQRLALVTLVVVLVPPATAGAQEVPNEYATVLTTLGKTGTSRPAC